MLHHTKTLQRHIAAQNIRAILGVERLESRNLLAGLINVGDTIIETDQNLGSLVPESGEVCHDVGSAVAGRPVETEHPPVDGDPVYPLDGDQEDGGCLETELETSEADGDPSQPLQSGADDDRPEPAMSTKSAGSLIAPLALPLNQSYLDAPQARPLLLSTTNALETDASSFHYFSIGKVAVPEEQPSLDNEPLVHDAVRETFFANSLLTPSEREQSTVFPADATRTVVPSMTAGQTMRNRPENSQGGNAIAALQPEEREVAVAVALAEAMLRSVDQVIGSHDEAAIDAALVQVVDEANDAAIALNPPRTNADEPRTPFVLDGWQIGLFSLISMMVSTRTFSIRHTGSDLINHTRSRGENQC
ncbi:hypothetical protein NHH03_25080 [Stieleria sp. TO1_6]|uniref:hypothetical protein n=1 Tax=Stieleria tagensis TaxID=2956795 RepID=UPI00209B9A7C|nr:hypothetical protein [Stieleria tagensis]MCO8125035.1 hypothetical protein [Stieleria tagensis]